MNTEQGMSNDEVNSQNQNKRKFDLEERQMIFAILIMKVSENLHTTPAGRYISGQVVPSGTSPALHYVEAQSAESRADFVYKLKVLLKEFRETFVGLKIIKRVPLTSKMDIVEKRMNRVQRINCNF